MKFLFSKKIWIVLISLVAVAAVFIYNSRSTPIDYNTQVKPIFNKKCITCHGGVKQKAGFSLLFREEALGNTKSGRPAIIPGKPGQSELIKRITNNDPEERMPYKHEPLSKDEINVLRQWIKEGANWGEHWAYIPVVQQKIPSIKDSWIKNEIDPFILEKLKEEKLTPSPEADKADLLRRVSLDITGLPPTQSIAKKFLDDQSASAYPVLVDDLLASSAYGERWTSLWLDLARYADTRGYEADRSRNIWKYRDWLIKAFNADKPYNDFIIEQVAGDLMPNPDDAKYIATSFHRNTMTNDEGGTDNEEFRTAAVLDRVNTTWSALMGTTFNCVQCHSHPYDPFKHEEYYKFMAFFNNSRDEDTQSEYPVLMQYDSTDNIKLAEVTDWLKKYVSEESGKYYYTFLKTWQPTINSLQCDQFVNGALLSSWYAGLRKDGSCRLPNVVLDNKKQFMFRYTSNFKQGKLLLYIDSLNGPLVKTIPVVNSNNNWKVETITLPPIQGKHSIYFKYVNPTFTSFDVTGMFFDWFQFGDFFPGKENPGHAVTYKKFVELLHVKREETPIMVESNPDQFRSTYVFERGNWMVKGKEVTPDVPHVMNPMPANAPKNRLGLSLWLTDKKNPLTARTMVNRLWEQFFGYGLVETLEDMGTQGITPTHKELLDHLSWKFMNDYNWSVKKLIREMVLSATYRQQSNMSEELLKRDPNNKLYARGPRVRLSAEQLRDQALAVSNLLSNKMYGKSVMPFQPDGIWRSPYNEDRWQLSTGEDQFRRALYTYWKRTAPYPSMITFDGGAREVCITRRIRTNTPLQALTTLNDSTYLVMARHFAFTMKDKGGDDVQKQIRYGYESMMFKPISPKRLSALIQLYTGSFNKFKKDDKASCEMIGAMNKYNNPESAALVIVANAMLNLDEWVNKN